MKKYRRTTTATPQNTYFKKRIGKTHNRAKFVGLLYLLCIIAFAAAAICLPLIENEFVNIRINNFFKSINKENLKAWKEADVFLQLSCSALYALMILGLCVNVLKGLGKLGWLYKKKAHREYGFNRNVYAMKDLGKIFSGSFAVLITTYFLISAFCEGYFKANTYTYIVLGAGAALRLLLGYWGAKVSYFDLHDEKIHEEKRQVGRFAPVLRNLLQLATVVGILYYFLKAFYVALLPVILLEGKAGIDALLDDTDLLISLSLQVFALLCALVLIKHATATTEYSHDGARGKGMKNFRIFTFLIALASAGVFAVHYFMLKTFDEPSFKFAKSQEMYMLFIVGIALLMFVVELIMRKHPKHVDEKQDGKAEAPVEDDELHIDSLSLASGAAMANTAATAKTPAPAYPPMPAPAAMPQPQVGVYPQYVPYPYPVYQQLPCQMQAAAPAVVKEEVKAPESDETANMEKVENGKAELNCPYCNARLRVDGKAEYHRCPSCRKVFQLRKLQK